MPQEDKIRKKQLPGHVYAINLTVIRDGLFVGT